MTRTLLPGQTAWELTLEPVGADVAWSLLQATPDGIDAVDSGLLTGCQDAAAQTLTIPPTFGGDAVTFYRHPFTRLDTEEALARDLGRLLIPERLRDALTYQLPYPSNGGPRTEDPEAPARQAVHIATRGWLAGVPWDTLVVDPARGTRLLETALVVSRMSPTVTASRARIAPPTPPTAPGVALIDTGPPLPERHRHAQIYPGGLPALLTGLEGIHGQDVIEPDPTHPGSLDADQLGELLRHQSWSRLLYLGHIKAGTPQDPAAASLLLTRDGQAQAFTAADWLGDPHRWPSPPRVALIGCGSDDSPLPETSGLPVAAINAGAHLVTCTRWPLPADPADHHQQPTTRLALAVHHAHQQPQPLQALRRWQLDQLHWWRTTGDPAASPLSWGAVTSYTAPPPEPVSTAGSSA